MHPIPDKAEVAVDFPDKLYIGGFGRDSAFEVRSEPDGVLVRLLRAGPDRREVKIYLHHLLLTDILCDLDTPEDYERLRRAELDTAAGSEYTPPPFPDS